MVDIIPSVFNRIDFWAMLLPGYVALILSMILFSPSIFFVNQNNISNTIAKGEVNSTSNGTQSISFDIFSAVVFIVAGPAIGFTLSQAVIFCSFVLFYRNKYEWLLAYSHLRAECNEETRLELDAIDARVIFNSSTGVVLLIIGLLLIFQGQVGIDVYVKQLLNSSPLFKKDHVAARTITGIMIIVVAGILLSSAFFEALKVRIPLVCKLLKENGIDEQPSACEQYNQEKET